MDLSSIKRLNLLDFTLALLLAMCLVALLSGNGAALPSLVSATVCAALLDFILNAVLKGKQYLPKSGIAAGLIVGMVLGPSGVVPAAIVSGVAVLSKHVLRYNGRQLFNPAAFGLVAGTLLLGTADSWWAATVTWFQPLTLLLVPLAILASWRVAKLRLTLASIASYAVLTVAYIGVGSVLSTAGAFNLLSLLFFAGVMLVEPFTSTSRKNAMLAQGILVSLVSWALLVFAPSVAGAADVLLVSLLLVNLAVPWLNATLG